MVYFMQSTQGKICFSLCNNWDLEVCKDKVLPRYISKGMQLENKGKQFLHETIAPQ